MRGETLRILLIEGNPGDARLIEEMLQGTTELARRTGGGPDASLVVHHERRLAAGLEFLEGERVDLVLLGLSLSDSSGLDTLDAVVEETSMLPIIVLTGLEDREAGIEAIEGGAQEYLVKEDVTSDLLVRSIHHALERNRQDRAEARRREQLEALNRLNRIAQGVTHAVITTSTREDLERAVCDRLVEADAYQVAWIGGVTGREGAISPRTAAGVAEGHFDDVPVEEVPLDPHNDRGEAPSATAARTHQVEVIQELQTDLACEPLREAAIDGGYRSAAAVPILHEDVLYGVLNVYAASPTAFSDPEPPILARLGNVIGHAIAAIERKEALVTDSVTELEFSVEGVIPKLVSLSTEEGCTIRVPNLIQGEESLLAYGEARGVSRSRFRDAVEGSAEMAESRVLGGDSAEFEFELATTAGQSLFDALATHGATVDSVTLSEGELRFIVEFPGVRNTRSLIDLVTDHCPGATLLAKRTDQEREEATTVSPAFEDRLTDKQWDALQTAYLAGHFEWPRDTNGEQIADRLGITPPTFHQHLRAAEKSVFDLVFEEG